MADYNSAYTGQEIDAGIAKANAAVPGSRTVNGKALSADVTLSAADVGARADNWTPDAAEVGADPAGTAETKANAVQTNLTSHTNNKSNPHGVTAAQVGAVPTSQCSGAGKPDGEREGIEREYLADEGGCWIGECGQHLRHQ